MVGVPGVRNVVLPDWTIGIQFRFSEQYASITRSAAWRVLEELQKALGVRRSDMAADVYAALKESHERDDRLFSNPEPGTTLHEQREQRLKQLDTLWFQMAPERRKQYEGRSHRQSSQDQPTKEDHTNDST